jgi:hypothetical protein
MNRYPWAGRCGVASVLVLPTESGPSVVAYKQKPGAVFRPGFDALLENDDFYTRNVSKVKQIFIQQIFIHAETCILNSVCTSAQ